VSKKILWSVILPLEEEMGNVTEIQGQGRYDDVATLRGQLRVSVCYHWFHPGHHRSGESRYSPDRHYLSDQVRYQWLYPSQNCHAIRYGLYRHMYCHIHYPSPSETPYFSMMDLFRLAERGSKAHDGEAVYTALSGRLSYRFRCCVWTSWIDPFSSPGLHSSLSCNSMI